MSPGASTPTYERAHDCPNHDPKRTGDKNAKQRSLVGVGRQDHGSEKPGRESNETESQGPEARSF